MRKDSRVGQFTIGSLLFLATFVAIFCGLVRWLLDSGQRTATWTGDEQGLFVLVADIALLLVILGIPFVLPMTESLVWFAAWLVRRPVVRRWIFAQRR